MVKAAAGFMLMPLRLAAVNSPHRAVMAFVFLPLLVSFLFRIDTLTATFFRPAFTVMAVPPKPIPKGGRNGLWLF
jgi:hypothetical protein